MTIGGKPRNAYLDDSWVGKRSSDAAKDLSDYGIPVTSREAYTLQQFVAEVLRGNAFPQERAYRTLGWHNDVLCAPNLDDSILIPPIGFDWFEGYKVAKCDERSAVEAWQHLNELAQENPVIYVAEGAGLAAPFLVNLPRTQYISSTIHIHSPSTGTGKTTLMDIAAATNGDPRSLVRTWDGTKVGMETTFGTVRHMTIFLNELGDAKFGTPCDVVMMLPEEKGRSRGTAGGGLRPTFEWRTLVLSTGNAPIAQGSAHHARRVLSVPVALCSEDFAYEGQRISQRYYGWPLKWCAPLYKTTALAERLDEIAHCYEKLYTGELSPLKPQARSWALVETGARMLLAILGMDEAEAHTGILKVAQMSALRRQAEGVDYVQKLIDIVREAVARDPAGFGASLGSERPRQGNKGRVFTADDGDGDEWTQVAVLPGVLQEITKNANIPDLTGTLIEAREQGILKVDKDKARLQKVARVGGTSTRCYVFDLSVTTGDDDDGNNFERAVTTCYHPNTFVTTVTTKNITPFIYIKKGNSGGNSGNSGNKEKNTIKNTINPVTTSVTTGGNKAISSTDDTLPTSKPNGSVEV